MQIYTPEYAQVFALYLRKGFHHALDALEAKAEARSTHYIWRTQEDDKVRPSHAANDGKIFEWDHPPETGNPGEDYGCRCWAEPVDGKEYARQILISHVNDNPDPWTNVDFSLHYFFGKHMPVTLQQTGYLNKIIRYYADRAIASDGFAGVYRGVNQQIIDEAIRNGEGGFTYDFTGTYNFKEVLYTFRYSTVSGVFSGDARKEGNFLVISGIVSYDYSDKFEDPLSFVEVLQYIGLTREEAEAVAAGPKDFLGDIYRIDDSWKTKFNASVKLE